MDRRDFIASVAASPVAAATAAAAGEPSGDRRPRRHAR